MKTENEPAGNLTAFAEGQDAYSRDFENATITDNPYTEGTEAHRSWYRGYNYETEGKPLNTDWLE